VKQYWDTSAVINALVSASVWRRLESGQHVTRLHTLYEFYSTVTGRGIKVTDQNGAKIPYTLSPSDAAAWLRNFSARVQIADLNLPQTLDGLDQGSAKGIQGAMVYDYGHSLAADLANADLLLTRNTDDFTHVGGSVRLEWP
jgi:hypothetical protein